MKKKKIIKVITMITLTLVIICATVLGIVKYKADNRYLQYAELEADQVILVQVKIGYIDDNKVARIHAVDVEGDFYSVVIPYEEWEGIEVFYDEITDGKLREDYKSRAEMEEIYGYLMQIDDREEYRCISFISIPIQTEEYYYGICYKENGEKEYIKFLEDRADDGIYLLDDMFAKEVYYMIGDFL